MIKKILCTLGFHDIVVANDDSDRKDGDIYFKRKQTFTCTRCKYEEIKRPSVICRNIYGTTKHTS